MIACSAKRTNERHWTREPLFSLGVFVLRTTRGNTRKMCNQASQRCVSCIVCTATTPFFAPAQRATVFRITVETRSSLVCEAISIVFVVPQKVAKWMFIFIVQHTAHKWLLFFFCVCCVAGAVSDNLEPMKPKTRQRRSV